MNKETEQAWALQGEPKDNWPSKGFYQHVTTDTNAPVIVYAETEEQTKLRARLIVTAVNSYDKSLAALKAVDTVFQRMNQPTSAVHGPDCLGDDEHEAWGMVRVAIADAERREGEKAQ